MEKEYARLLELYSKRTKAELEAIIASGDDYTELAKSVARDILVLKECETEEKTDKNEEKLMKQEVIREQLYDDIHQLAGDVRFIKNVIVAGLLLFATSAILGIFVWVVARL